MLVHSWIMNSFLEFIAQSIVLTKNVVDVWNTLKEYFLHSDLIQIYEFQQDVYSLIKDPCWVIEFFYDLKVLWEELEFYLPTPTCTCRFKCSCEAMRNAYSNHKLSYIICFPISLNLNFSMVKYQVLRTDILPPLNKVFYMVILHELLGNFVSYDDVKVLINVVDFMKVDSIFSNFSSS